MPYETVYGKYLSDLSALIQPLAAGAQVSSAAGDITLTWDDVAVRISRMSPEAIGAHLEGFLGYVNKACEIHDITLPDRIPGFRTVLGCVIEPALDDAGKAHDLVLRLAEALQGVVFSGDIQSVIDPQGMVLAIARKDEESPPEPPDAMRVLRRAYCLCAVAMRGTMELEARSAPAESTWRDRLLHLTGASRRQLSRKVESVRNWLNTHGVGTELEAAEESFLTTPVGAADQRNTIDATWRSEGICVLAWALGTDEMPPHDGQVEPRPVSEALGFLGEPKHRPELRTPEELEWMERRLLGIHWRFRDFRLRPNGLDFVAFSANNWFGGFDIAGIPLAEGDIAVGGVPIARAGADAVRLCESIAAERHQAINWLSGQTYLYSDVDTST